MPKQDPSSSAPDPRDRWVRSSAPERQRPASSDGRDSPVRLEFEEPLAPTAPQYQYGARPQFSNIALDGETTPVPGPPMGPLYEEQLPAYSRFDRPPLVTFHTVAPGRQDGGSLPSSPAVYAAAPLPLRRADSARRAGDGDNAVTAGMLRGTALPRAGTVNTSAASDAAARPAVQKQSQGQSPRR